MKKFSAFFSENLGLIVKFVVSQVSITAFSLIITIAMRLLAQKTSLDKTVLYALASVAGIGFFWFIIHDFFWQNGAKYAPAIEAGRMERDKYKGLKIGATAMIPTYLFSLIYIVSYIIAVPTQNVVFGSINAVASLPLFYVLDGMFYGLFSMAEGTFFMPVIALISCAVLTFFPALAYALGTREKKLRSYVGLGNVNLPESNKDKKY